MTTSTAVTVPLTGLAVLRERIPTAALFAASSLAQSRLIYRNLRQFA